MQHGMKGRLPGAQLRRWRRLRGSIGSTAGRRSKRLTSPPTGGGRDASRLRQRERRGQAVRHCAALPAVMRQMAAWLAPVDQQSCSGAYRGSSAAASLTKRCQAAALLSGRRHAAAAKAIAGAAARPGAP